MLERTAKQSSARRSAARLIWSSLPSGVRTWIRKLWTAGAEQSEQPPRVEECARDYGIPTVQVEKHSSEATKAILEANGISVVLLASSAWLIKEPLLSMKETKIINVHPGWLPH